MIFLGLLSRIKKRKMTQTKQATVTWHHIPVSDDDPEVKSFLNPRNPTSGPAFCQFTTRGRWATATGLALASPKEQVGWGFFHGVPSPLSWERAHRFLSYPRPDCVSYRQNKRSLDGFPITVLIWLKISRFKKNFLEETVVCNIHTCWWIDKLPIKALQSLLSSKWTQIPCLYMGLLRVPCSKMHL